MSFLLSLPQHLKKIILDAPTKSCTLNPLPTEILKECIKLLLAPLKDYQHISGISTIPEHLEKPWSRHCLKKPSLDKNILKNHKSIRNLSFLSKILERVVPKTLNTHSTTKNLKVPLQSTYHKHHSMKTALLKVHHGVL